MQLCIRPHCAIRSHKHDFTFADFLMLDEKYRKIARSLKDVENIKNYKILSGSLELYDRHICCEILFELLKYFESIKNLDLKKLVALYVFSICKTGHVVKFMQTENSKLRNEMINAYNRLLRDSERDGDRLFVSEMKKLVPVL